MDSGSICLGVLPSSDECENHSQANNTEVLDDPFHQPNYPEDCLAILSFAIRLGIPSVNLCSHEGVRPKDSILPDVQPERLAYALGSGATCVVTQHDTDGETSGILPPGTRVALKRYIQAKSWTYSEEHRQHRRLYRQVWQDLAVCSHPYLKTHENICKVKYLCWEDHSLIPIFALEFADYGTLEHVVSNSEGLLTDELRSHLSLDILTGLAALHACDFVHGDIKPANIVVRRNKERQILAQLTDFAGAETVTKFGTGGHLRFHTNEWLAPEVLRYTVPIDWQRADVFSTGLVLAHLWCAEERVGKCFLESMIPIGLQGEERLTAYMSIKLHQKNEGDHLIVTCLDRQRRLLQMRQHRGELEQHQLEHSQGFPIQLKLCLNKALSVDVDSRFSASALTAILHESKVFEARLSEGRGCFEPPLELRLEISAIPRREQMLGRCFIPMEQYLHRTPRFQKTTAMNLAKMLGVTLNQPCKWPTSSMVDIVDASYTDYSSVLLWFNDNNFQAVAKAQNIGAYGYAFELAQSYLLGLGVVYSERLALDALSYAAQGAVSVAMAMFPSIEASCRPTARDKSADREYLWLSYGMRNDCHETYDRARLVSPQLYRTTRGIVMARLLFTPMMNDWLLQLKLQPCEVFLDLMNMLRIQDVLDSDSGRRLIEHVCNPGIRPLHAAAGLAHLSTLQWLVLSAKADIHVQDQVGRPPIWYAVEAGDLDCIQFLLQHGANANFVDNTSRSLLHKASFHDDNTATRIALLLLQHGASLEPVAEEKPTVRQNPFVQAVGQPLRWAIFKNRTKLFATLLKAHYENDIPIALQTWILMMKTIGIYSHSEIFEEIWNFRFTSPSNLDPPKLLREFLTLLIRWTVREPSYYTIGCRWLLGAEYYPRQAKFLKRLLCLGADPLIDGPPGLSPLAYTFACGDRQALEIIFDHLEGKGVNVLELLTIGWNNHSPGIWPLVNAKCSDGLIYVLERFPSLVNAELHWEGKMQFDLKHWPHSVAQFKPHGRTGRALHVAASFGNLSATQALLDAGADIYDRDNIMDATALELALLNGDIDIAESMMEGADKSRLFGPPSEAGNTLFGRLVNRQYSVRRRVPLEVFRFLRMHDALDFVVNVNQGLSIWGAIFPQSFVSRRDLIEEDLRLLEFLLQPDVFLDRIHDCDSTGMAAIHYACRYGNYESVKLLIHKGAQVNQEAHESKNFLFITPRTATPLELFVPTAIRPPKVVLAGGQEELRLWHEDRQALSSLLMDLGARRGSLLMSFDTAFEEAGVFDKVTKWADKIWKPKFWQTHWPAKLLDSEHRHDVVDESTDELATINEMPRPAKDLMLRYAQEALKDSYRAPDLLTTSTEESGS